VRLHLNPEHELSELPLKRWYRAAHVGGAVRFRGLPLGRVLTLKVETPEGWIVAPTRADADTDNLRLGAARARPAVEARFALKHLLVAGQCDDLTHGRPPNGLRLELRSAARLGGGAPSTARSGRGVDTLVMQNLGYFQLKGGPGAWSLRLADGRGKDLYAIRGDRADALPDGGGPTGVDGDDAGGEDDEFWGADGTLDGEGPAGGGSSPGARADLAEGPTAPYVEAREKRVFVRSFSMGIEQLRVFKRPGREPEALLEGPDDAASGTAHGGSVLPAAAHSLASTLMGWGSSLLGSSSDGGDAPPHDAPAAAAVPTSASALAGETVHVFSLATGHLYERFLRIMMLSAVKRSSRPIKFWLLENFLSPRFKRELPALAARVGFDFALVTYRWPSWLRQQTEKQRIIWGYKILFLDVLFPLSLDKVIYVDADQVVRADLAELWEMDLGGAAYGYAPFCDSNEETLGFQFWRQGYWADHLKGRPYHISALYVVDLRAFRARAVGDTLRALYDQLSRDEGSLSNLDQDLPNYAQHLVPIFTLPQEWLWCESWCSRSTLNGAKTVDLCNNPLHKEAKLDMARRIVSGEHFAESWTELDLEARTAAGGGRGSLGGAAGAQRARGPGGSEHGSEL
jgi:UDP-glucose:glycoprotein glucosyltransferase